jgi:hypothetical protein
MAITKVRNPNGSIIKVEHPDDASQESILGFAASQFNRGQGEEGIVGDALKALEVGFRSPELKGRAGMVETGVKLKDMASPTYYTPVPMMGMPTMSARQLEEEGIEAGKPIEEPEVDLFREDALQFAENLRIEANAMSNTVGLDKDFAQSLPGEVIQGIGQYGTMIMYGLVGGQAGLTAQIAGQMDTEALEEAERTTGKKFAEMSDEEKQQANLIRLGQQTIGTGLNMFAFSKLIPTNLKSKVSQFLTNKGTLNRQEFTQVVNSLRKDIAVSMASEGVTESAEAFSLDLLTKYSGLDSNREVFSVENIRENLYQGLVGSLSAGGTTTISGGIGKGLERIGQIKVPTPETKAVSEEEVSGKKKFRVKYTRTTKEIGQADVVSEGVREFDAKDEAEAKKIVEGSTGKLPGVDLESIIIEEVQPTETKVEPTVEPTVEPEVDQEPITEVTRIQQELAELADVFASEMETKGSAPEIRKQIQAKEAELKVAEEAQAKARQEARDAEVKVETDRILKEHCLMTLVYLVMLI